MKIDIKTKLKLSPLTVKYQSLKKDFKKYLKAVMMLVKDAFQINKKRFIAVLVNSAAGIGLMGAALGVLLQYVKQLESGTMLSYFGYTFNTRDGYLLFFISLSSMILLIIGAGLVLYARIKTRDILVDLHMRSLPRVASKYGWDPPDSIAWVNDSTLRTDVRTIYLGDSQRAGLVLRRFFEGYQHLLMSVGGIIVLLWLDLAATLFLLLIILASLGFFYKINRRASGATRGHENISAESIRRSRAILDNVSSWPNSRFDSKILHSITHEGMIKESSMLFFDRFVTRSLTEFLSFALTGVALGFLLLTLGYSAIKDETSWAAVVGFIVVLKMVMQALKNFFKLITEVTRLYPSISRLYDFNKKQPKQSSKNFIDRLSLNLGEDIITDKKEKKIVLEKGDILAMSAPVTLSRHSIRFFASILAGSRKKKKITALINSIVIAAPIAPPAVDVALGELLGLPEGAGADELRKAAGSRAGKIEKVFPLDPHTVITQRDFKKLSKDSVNRLSLMAALISDRPVVPVHNSLVTDEWLKEFKDQLGEKILVVCYNGLPGEPVSVKADVKLYIAAASDLTIAAAGSFSMMRKKKKQAAELLLQRQQELMAKSEKLITASGSEEDEDDE